MIINPLVVAVHLHLTLRSAWEFYFDETRRWKRKGKLKLVTKNRRNELKCRMFLVFSITLFCVYHIGVLLRFTFYIRNFTWFLSLCRRHSYLCVCVVTGYYMLFLLLLFKSRTCQLSSLMCSHPPAIISELFSVLVVACYAKFTFVHIFRFHIRKKKN